MTRKLVIVGAALLLCAVTITAAMLVARQGLSSKARRAWKENAIAQIASQTGATAPTADRIASMRNRPSAESEWDGWISKDLIVMTNGEWMAYRSVCAKEASHIPDLFISRGSDGKWHYSTYHFCIDMLVLKSEEQPPSLTKFRTDYFLQEFDGHSDECLKKTWPLRH